MSRRRKIHLLCMALYFSPYIGVGFYLHEQYDYDSKTEELQEEKALEKYQKL